MSYLFKVERHVNKRVERLATMIMALTVASVVVGFCIGWMARLIAVEIS